MNLRCAGAATPAPGAIRLLWAAGLHGKHVDMRGAPSCCCTAASSWLCIVCSWAEQLHCDVCRWWTMQAATSPASPPAPPLWRTAPPPLTTSSSQVTRASPSAAFYIQQPLLTSDPLTNTGQHVSLAGADPCAPPCRSNWVREPQPAGHVPRARQQPRRRRHWHSPHPVCAAGSSPHL